MKLLKTFLSIGLFFISIAFTACNQNSKDNNSTNTIGYSDSSTVKKDSASVTNDTLTDTKGVNGGATKNNPDITR